MTARPGAGSDGDAAGADRDLFDPIRIYDTVRGHAMRYRWDPAYPMGRRFNPDADPSMRVSDAERNEVADKLSRHFAEGRLDQTEFKERLDTAMSAVTRSDLDGLFRDLPRLTEEPPPPPPRRRRIIPFIVLVALVAVLAGSTLTFPFWAFAHVPWLLIALVAFFVVRREGRLHRRHSHRSLER
jgi:hypothetical protein